MTRVHTDYYTRVSSHTPDHDARGDLVLEARLDDDGTVWVRVVREIDDGRDRFPIMSENLELMG